MEAAVASGLLKVAGNKLISLIGSEFAAMACVDKDLSELHDIHGEITSWLSTVRDGSIEPNGDKHGIFDRLREKPKSFVFRGKMAHRIKDIKAEYNDILGQRRDANAIRNNLQVDHPMQKSNKIIGEASMLSNVEESKIAIRDREKDKIVSKLLDSNEEENFWIVSIVGLGGSGKTTMAKHICHVYEIKELFKNRIFWVHVSEEFDVQKLIGKLYETITGKKPDYQPQQQMVLEISEELSGNKFLLVLDAWHTDRYEWGQFMVHLQDRSPGSRILLTTRDQKVAEAVECKHIHDLVFLSDSDSWSLFLKSSGLVENDLGSDFTQVGKDILKRCGGVPLAIRTIAGVLREKTEIGTWRAIRGSELWNVESITDRVFASLKLSYIHLADELKQCFTFCSIFPKGCLINKDHLAAQWMAHGFIMPMKEEHPEDIASEYFDSLVKAGFFLRDTEESFDFISVYKMHDLIHDRAQYCENNKVVTSLARNMITNQTHTCRYLSLTSETEKVKRGLLDKVRALYMSDGNISFDKPVKKSCYVRSVVLDSKNLTPFPPFLLKFEYLGYLEICNVECKKIPEAISGCWNLQSLHFIRYNGFVMLPECIGKLKKLRTLELDIVDDLEGLPQSIGDCQDLQSLKIDCCDNLQGIPASIGKIENLRMLHITSCSALRKLPSKPCEHNLTQKDYGKYLCQTI
ncbi:putative disease resistance protein RGA1 [Oryza brachyantha]|uniref:putative disease resistance protein RGA1 n=1 Tax=Oryza brachyantha TaxID=4533 RepID=UPI001ADB831A|nr:putative disease resistance protein RGA1 [Oryza brachyantha]